MELGSSRSQAGPAWRVPMMKLGSSCSQAAVASAFMRGKMAQAAFASVWCAQRSTCLATALVWVLRGPQLLLDLDMSCDCESATSCTPRPSALCVICSAYNVP